LYRYSEVLAAMPTMAAVMPHIAAAAVGLYKLNVVDP
jgi:hypothetical protein